jgi:hypothetical protein
LENTKTTNLDDKINNMIILFIIAFILNMLAAVALKSLIEDSDLYWLKNKLVRVILLVPPISIATLIIGSILAGIITMIDGMKDYLN